MKLIDLSREIHHRMPGFSTHAPGMATRPAAPAGLVEMTDLRSKQRRPTADVLAAAPDCASSFGAARWSTAHACADAGAAFTRAGIRWTTLPASWDVDEPADFARWDAMRSAAAAQGGFEFEPRNDCDSAATARSFPA